MTWKAILYDWGGMNAALFQFINQGTPTHIAPLAWVFSNLLGNYWTAPLLMLGLWRWSCAASERSRSAAVERQLVRFVTAFALAMVVATVLKLLFDFPRPPAVYGELVRVIGTAERRCSLPSGHSMYAAIVAGVLWPLVGPRLRLVLASYVGLVGWSRIAAGMHFPADVLAGWVIGFGCLPLASRLQAWLSATAKAMAPLRAFPWYVLAVLIVLADQASKFAVALTLAYGEQVRVSPLFNLVHIGNQGAAFGLLASAGGWQRYMFIALALGVSAWLIWLLHRGISRTEKLGYCLILGGALGNGVDRVVRGMVVDYLDFHWATAHWPAFNVADAAISLGAICLICTVTHRRDSPAYSQA